ncbi:MAG: hypothetical protein ABIR39_23035 [Nocardioides sp.]|uniref:hypothetical protein n=1 Tax=Nocardioides sp. TaxID=35761 RepID=UPI003265A7D3
MPILLSVGYAAWHWCVSFLFFSIECDQVSWHPARADPRRPGVIAAIHVSDCGYSHKNALGRPLQMDHARGILKNGRLGRAKRVKRSLPASAEAMTRLESTGSAATSTTGPVAIVVQLVRSVVVMIRLVVASSRRRDRRRGRGHGSLPRLRERGLTRTEPCHWTRSSRGGRAGPRGGPGAHCPESAPGR